MILFHLSLFWCCNVDSDNPLIQKYVITLFFVLLILSAAEIANKEEETKKFKGKGYYRKEVTEDVFGDRREHTAWIFMFLLLWLELDTLFWPTGFLSLSLTEDNKDIALNPVLAERMASNNDMLLIDGGNIRYSHDDKPRAFPEDIFNPENTFLEEHASVRYYDFLGNPEFNDLKNKVTEATTLIVIDNLTGMVFTYDKPITLKVLNGSLLDTGRVVYPEKCILVLDNRVSLIESNMFHRSWRYHTIYAWTYGDRTK